DDDAAVADVIGGGLDGNFVAGIGNVVGRGQPSVDGAHPVSPRNLWELEVGGFPNHVEYYVQVVFAIEAGDGEGEHPGVGVAPLGLVQLVPVPRNLEQSALVGAVTVEGGL